MTDFQTAANVRVVVNREDEVGVKATATGATVMRYISSQGLELKRANIQSQEKRPDGLTPMGRLGGKSVTGDFMSELSMGGVLDILLEAVMRSTWTPAVHIAFASVTSISTSTNAVMASGGDWINTQGVRVGDIFTLSNHSSPENNNINLPVVAVTTLTIITSPGALVSNAVVDATGTLTILKKVVTADVPTRFSHTIEQHDTDLNNSEIFLGNRCIGVKLSFKPGAMATAQFTFLGLDREVLVSNSYFTTPAVTTGIALIADDSGIRYDGAQIATFTGFDLNFQITAKGEPVIGSFVSPDVFDNNCMVDGTITALRSDFSNLTLFDSETEFEVSIMLQEPNGAPKGVLAFFLPRVKIGGVAAPVGGGDGAKVETLTLMTGPKVAAAGYDGTIAVISSSAP